MEANIIIPVALKKPSHLFLLVERLFELDEHLVLPEELRVSDGLLGGLQQLSRRHGCELRDLVLGKELGGGHEEVRRGESRMRDMVGCRFYGQLGVGLIKLGS